MSKPHCSEGWILVSLGDVAVWGSGGTPSRKISAFYDGNIPWVKTGDLGPKVLMKASEYITVAAVENSSAKLFPKGSVALAMYGATIGKTSILGIDATTNQACAVGQPVTDITTSEFLYYLLRNEKDNFIAKGKGGAQPNISQTLIKEHQVAIPSLAEQKQIAAKLDDLLSQVDTLKTRLNAIPSILKRFRQSVLAAAVSGRLTEEWRKCNETNDIAELVEKVNKKKKGKLKVRLKKGWDNELILYDLPRNWAWTLNHKLAIDESTAICAGPFGTIFKAKDFREEGVPIIFLRHVKEDGFNQNKQNYMDRAVWEEYHQEYSVHGGELLVTKLGAPPGESCIYPTGLGTAMVTPDVLKMNVDSRVTETKYLMHFFNSPLTKDIIKELAFGATRLRIDIAMFKGFPIPLPPREEQSEIIRRVEHLFTFSESVEQKAQAALDKVNNLTQSILSKAFRGELTADWREQNPDLISGDNSAKKLLEKIRAKKEKKKLVKKTRSKKAKVTE